MFQPFWGKPAGEAEYLAVAHHRVIAAVLNDAVVSEDVVHVPGESLTRLMGVGDHRVSRRIGACHHQHRVCEVREKEVVEGGIREHTADGMQFGYCFERTMILFFQNDDGMGGATEALPFCC